MLKEKETEIIEQEYFIELQKIKDTIKHNQNKAMVIVNSTAIINKFSSDIPTRIYVNFNVKFSQ